MSLVLYVIVFPCSPIPTKFGIRQIQEWLLDGGAALHLITPIVSPLSGLGIPTCFSWLHFWHAVSSINFIWFFKIWTWNSCCRSCCNVMVLDLSTSVWGLMEPKLRNLDKYIFFPLLPIKPWCWCPWSLSRTGSGREPFWYPLLLGWLPWETLSWLRSGGWGKGWGDTRFYLTLIFFKIQVERGH